MGKILLSPKILGKHFGTVVLQHAQYFGELKKVNMENLMKDLHGNLRGQEYADMFHGYFRDELILRME